MFVLIVIFVFLFIFFCDYGNFFRHEDFRGNLSASPDLHFSYLSPYEKSHLISPHTYRYMNDGYTEGLQHGMFYGFRYDSAQGGPKGCSASQKSPELLQDCSQTYDMSLPNTF